MEVVMPKPEWGVKHTCMSCGARFYDMLRNPVVCPKCESAVDVSVIAKPKRARTGVAAATASKVVDRDEELIDEEDAEAVEDEEDGEVPLEEPVIDLADGDDAEDAGEGDGEEDEELEDFEDDVLLGDEAGDEELEELGEDPEDLAKL